jgi:antirestriction protein ArdC
MTTITTTRKAQRDSGRVDNYTRVSDSIVSALTNPEAPRAPWNSPYTYNGLSSLPMKMSNNKAYRGINTFILMFTAMSHGYTSPWWGTYKQILALGGQVRKGEKSTMVTWWSTFDKEVEDQATGEVKTKKFPVLKTFLVFNACQADWADGRGTKFFPAPGEAKDSGEVREAAQAIIEDYVAREGIEFVSQRQDVAYYSPAQDLINIPAVENMVDRDAWYLTTFHEMGHSTGHASRLNREGITELQPHGKDNPLYSFEELVAEMTAALLASATGFVTDSIVANTVAYCQSWAKYLTDNPKAAVQAAGQAQRAADRILGITWGEEAAEAPEAEEVLV